MGGAFKRMSRPLASTEKMSRLRQVTGLPAISRHDDGLGRLLVGVPRRRDHQGDGDETVG